MEPTVLLLLGFAANATGYVPHGPPPRITPVSAAFFRARPECQGIPDCALDGLFAPTEGKIFIEKRLVGIYRNSVLVHELTHFLQLSNGRFIARSCANYQARENQADEVQAKYINSEMRKAGKSDWVWNNEPRGCTESAAGIAASVAPAG